MSEPKILPFYMTYPMPIAYSQDQGMVRDLEYFQQIYPQGAKLLQREIAKMVHIIDYEGSMIYDEYPDQLSLRKLAKDMLDKLVHQKDTLPQVLQKLLENDCIEEYVFLVLLSEILKKRHKNDRGYLMF